MEKHIAVISGSEIGPEIVKGAMKVLDVIARKYGHRLVYTRINVGDCVVDKYKTLLPKENLDAALASGSVLLGAVDGPKWDYVNPSIRPGKALLSIRRELGLHTNLRPAGILREPSDASPLRKDTVANGVDSIVVRELIGGAYFGEKGTVEKNGGLHASDGMYYYAHKIEGIAHATFQMVRKKGNRVTSVDKTNMSDTSRSRCKVISGVTKEYPDITLTRMLMGNITAQIVRDLSQFNVIVTENMLEDILNDEASMVTDSIGLIPNTSLGEMKRGMYGPIRGSTPDIVGQNIANPIGTILAAGVILGYAFDMDQEAAEIEEAVGATPRLGHRTKDIMEGEKAYRTYSQIESTIAGLITNAQGV